jgi:hypothetical protein
MTMEAIVRLSEEFVDARLPVDSYRTQLVAMITSLDQTDIIVLALVLVQGVSTKQ